jgi:polysaccharide deacetylase family protein (PEP-CTERM system associated)
MQETATAAGRAPAPPGGEALRTVLSFDIEEHHRIEAAAGLSVSPEAKARYARRMDDTTRWLLDRLAAHGTRGTFFVVGEIARDNPGLVRAIRDGGHEVASHSWDHRRVHAHTPAGFREDVRTSRDALEQASGAAVVGYRAPTFSVVRQTAWALDVLAEEGFRYDSSVYPVRHDRYGVPGAPRAPFLAQGREHALLEIPPATLCVAGATVPAGGGGYFRLFPLGLMRWAVRQAARDLRPPVAMLYFHPWEFDPGQERLPLPALRRWRTYVGLSRSRPKLERLLAGHAFVRAVDVVADLERQLAELPRFPLAG